MADVPYGRNEFNASLAMLTHEGENGIVKLLKAGRTGDAFRYTAGLLDTWMNRAAGTGNGLIPEMSRRGQITDWDSNQSVIDQKARRLDSRIRDMAAAYMQERLNGGDPLFPKTNFYLNKDLVDYFHTVDPQKYSLNYRKWYNPATDVQAYGFRGRDGNGGVNSTETQFVANPNERRVPDSYRVVPRGDLDLRPTDAATRAYFLAKGRQTLPVDQMNALNAGLGRIDASNGLGFPGYMLTPDGRAVYYETPDADAPPRAPTGTNIFSDIGDGISGAIGGVGQFLRDAAGRITGMAAPADNGVRLGEQSFGAYFDPSAYLAANPDVASDAAFKQNPFNHYLQHGQFENRDLSPAEGLQTAAPGDFDFSGRNVSAGTGVGTFGAGIDPSISELGFAGGFNPSAYLAANPDVRAAGVNPFQHYLQHGLTEDRAIDQAGTRFDPSRYGIQNADVLAAGMDPRLHYAKFGAFEGREAPLVGPGANAPIVMNMGMASTIGPDGVTQFRAPDGTTFSRGPDGVVQPLGAGATAPTAGAGQAGRTLPPNFSEVGYYIANPDVWAAQVDASDHYLTHGIPEGRTIGPDFNEQAYLRANPDVAAAGVDPETHYLTHGIEEGRSLGEGNVAPLVAPPGGLTIGAPTAPTIGADGQQIGVNAPPGVTSGSGAPNVISGQRPEFDFDANAYLDANPDVRASGMGALPHFLEYGFNEGRALNTTGLRLDQRFDGTAYLAKNPDVAMAGLDPLRHFLEHGAHEGRSAELGSNPYSFGAFGGASAGAGGAGAGQFTPSGVQAVGGGSAGIGAAGRGGSSFTPSGVGAIGSGSAGIGAGGAGGGVVNLGMGAGIGGLGGRTMSPTGFSTANVSGFNPNAPSLSGGAPAAWGTGGFRPGFSGYMSDVAASNSEMAQQNFIQGQAMQRERDQGHADAAAFNRANVGTGSRATYQTNVVSPGGMGIVPVGQIQYTHTAPITPSPQVAHNVQQGANAQRQFFAGGGGGGMYAPWYGGR